MICLVSCGSVSSGSSTELKATEKMAVAAAVTASCIINHHRSFSVITYHHPPNLIIGIPKRRRKLEFGITTSNHCTRTQVRCKAVEQSQAPQTYQGIYGPWTIDSDDVREVVLYRSGLVVAAASFVIAASTAFLPQDTFLTDFLDQNLDLLYSLGSAGLGLSLYLIHIYVTEIKRTLQALWLLGVIGSVTTYLTLAAPAGENLVSYVVHHPIGVLFVGPLFASLTGLVFKEGLCYGKPEAALLAIVIPTCLLGHLSGGMDDGVKMSLLGVWVALFTVFSGRKFTQPIKDDIGDKSVFMFNALPEEEKKAVLEKFEKQ